MSQHRSVATISSPEFINITSISPFASKCEIKVLYLGQNRNRSFIDKEVATQMAQTLPGCPIVGYYSESQEDFMDHGDQVIIDGEGVKFKCLTVPYGFVAPDAKVWFKDFEDVDDFGNSEIRTYLMTEGYLWTQQYEAAQKVINEGRPQSMELDTETLKGRWSTDNNRGIDFFIINDAIFSKLCILGDNVEPCFEGAAVTAPNVSSTFSKDDDFAKTLYTMMQELKELTFSLKEKGGETMETQEKSTEVQAEEAKIDTPVVEENFSNNLDKDVLEDNAENQNNTEEFVKKEKEDENKEEKKEDSSNDSKDTDSKEEDNKADDDDKDDDEEKKKASKNTLNEDSNINIEEKYALLESQIKDLKNQYAALEAERNELMEFKASVEDKQKDDLINSFYMLSDEDKADVINNKAKYSLDDIEAKLSIICVRKKVNFNLDDNKEQQEAAPATTFNLNSLQEDESLPAWIKAVDARRENVN